MASSQRTSMQQRFRAQWGVWVLANILFVGAIAYEQMREYRNTLQAEKAHMLTQVRIAEQVLATQIRSADAALRTMLAGIDRWRGATGYLPFAQEHLKRVEQMMPGARTFVVLDADGVCQLSNRQDLIGVDMAQRPFFQQVQSQPEGHWLHIAPPHASSRGDMAVTISRAMQAVDGKFQGVVAATLSPQFFEDLMKEMRYAPDMQIAVMHSQGHLYVTSPPVHEISDESLRAQQGLVASHRETAGIESFQTGNPSIGPARLTMARTIDLTSLQATKGFVALASRSEAAVFEVWRRDVLMHTALWSVFFVLVSVVLKRYQQGALALLAKSQAAEEAMQRSVQRFEQVANTIPCVLFDFEIDHDGVARVLYVGPYSQTLLGLSPEFFMAEPTAFMQFVHADDKAAFESLMTKTLREGGGLNSEFRFVSPKGQERWLQMTATRGGSTENSGGTHWSGFLFDISEDKERQLALHSMAYQDVLTNAENRRSFMEKLQAELSRVQRTGEAGAVIMLDIDHFKKVNDTYGHDAGDAVLKHLVQVLHGGLRRVDTLGRLGGEEFAILLPATPLDSAMLLAERLRQTVQESPAALSQGSVSYTVSMGVSQVDGQSMTIDEILKFADKAMYEAKHTGRNRVCCARG